MFTAAYPKGAVLFAEEQSPRGIFMLCQGRVKLSCCACNGKTLIFKVAEPGEVLGLSATINGVPHELTAETLEPCQLNFAKRDDFLRFLNEHREACFGVAQHLSDDYIEAHREFRALGLSRSAGERLANLLLRWGSGKTKAAPAGVPITLSLTHEEISQMIGTSRETVTRLLADMKRRRIVQAKGATMQIQDKEALRIIANTQ